MCGEDNFEPVHVQYGGDNLYHIWPLFIIYAIILCARSWSLHTGPQRGHAQEWIKVVYHHNWPFLGLWLELNHTF